MERCEIVNFLREIDPGRLEWLWSEADRVRCENVGDEVHLRGLVEFSNHCSRLCGYCGLRAANTRIERYRMSEDEILAAAVEADRLGYGTVVLQSGEDAGLDVGWMSNVIGRIKSETPLAVTLSVGERGEDELAAWRRAGADRYLLRFETSARRLFDEIHPSRLDKHSDRIAILRTLDRLGYEVGSGVMIGIPGQSFDDLARDIELFAELDLDMIGVGPYIAHPDTPLGRAARDSTAHDIAAGQVPNNELMTYKVIALTRLACPAVHMPSTTALAALNTAGGRELGLARGANVVMPNVTPTKYRRLYDIYPNKACVAETAWACAAGIRKQLDSIGRTVGRGRGDSPNYRRRQNVV